MMVEVFMRIAFSQSNLIFKMLSLSYCSFLEVTKKKKTTGINYEYGFQYAFSTPTTPITLWKMYEFASS